MDKPQASAREKAIYVQVYTAGAKKIKVLQNRTEIIRSAQCPVCMKPSSRFEGLNEYGWLFWCTGQPDEGGRAKIDAHWFVASPAPDIRMLNREVLPKEIEAKAR